MDVREIYGGSDLQKQNPLAEEVARLSHDALKSGMLFALPVQVVEDSPDGHNSTIMPAVMRAILDPVTGERTFENHPVAPDTPVHFPGGAGAVLTHGLAAGDEGTALYLSRNIDVWRSSGGAQQPLDYVCNDHGDSVLIPGVRSDPRKLQQVAPDAMHARSDDKTVVHEVKPGTGVQSFHADPSTPPASATFDPLAQASKFLSHAVQAARGIVGRAVDGSTEHSHGVDHGVGAWMKAMGAAGLVQALAHPDLGALLSAADGKHTVTASPSGVQLQSATGISLDCPPGGLSLPLGGISGSSMQTGGDLSGTLDEAEVTNLAHVDARSLPVATSDAAAASAGVLIGGLYRDTSIASGKTVLVMRSV